MPLQRTSLQGDAYVLGFQAVPLHKGAVLRGHRQHHAPAALPGQMQAQGDKRLHIAPRAHGRDQHGAAEQDSKMRASSRANHGGVRGRSNAAVPAEGDWWNRTGRGRLP